MRKLASISGGLQYELGNSVLLHNLRFALVSIMRDRLHDATDTEAAEAVDNVLGTMRARSSGIIYEFKSRDPRVQMLTDELSSVTVRHLEGKGGFDQQSDEDISSCLRYLRKQLDQAGRRGVGFLELSGQAVGGSYTVSPTRRRSVIDGAR